MKKASTRLLEQETQTPSPAPDLIPAESSTENLHWDWYSKRGHFRDSSSCITQTGEPVRVQTFIPQPAVEAFYVRVLYGLSRLNKLQSHSARLRGLLRLLRAFFQFLRRMCAPYLAPLCPKRAVALTTEKGAVRILRVTGDS